MARPISWCALLQVFSLASFFSLWYWVLTVTVWTLVGQRTLGVPYDMLLRARRLPEVAAEVDVLAQIAARRIAALRDRLGVPLAAAVGFGLSVLAGLGFLGGIEPAQAAFALLFPLALVAAATVRLALEVRGGDLAGPALRRRLARRRGWNQAIACAAILGAAALALGHPPPGFL